MYCDEVYKNENGVSVGTSYIIQDNKPIDHGNRKVYGESVSFRGSIDDFENLLEIMKLEYTYENVGEIIVVSGYIPHVKYLAYVNGQKKNIQLAFNNGVISIGSPLILGSY